MRRLLSFLTVASIVAACAAHGAETASSPVVTKQTEVRLIAGTDGLGTGDVPLGLQFNLKPGWKIYWRTPGDAGYPPKLDWTESQNLESATMTWPAPVRFEVLGFQTMGYEKQVIFPIAAKAKDSTHPLKLRLHLDYLTCEDVCIPYTTDLSLDLAAGAAQPNSFMSEIAKYAAQVPGDGTSDGLAIERIESLGPLKKIDDTTEEGRVRITAASGSAFDHPDVFIEGSDDLSFGAPQVQFNKDRHRAVLTVPVAVDHQARLDEGHVRVTVTDGPRSAERVLDIIANEAPPAPSAPSLTLLEVLGLALLGGLILNLMPCVLPVLSLKVVSFVGGHRTNTRASFVATAAGIVASFLAIAVALIGVKLAGHTVGWGIQFQHPWFLGVMAALTALFAANLLGLYEIATPQWASSLGQKGGAFVTGAFATLLATPCSAPFLGTAIGFALGGTVGDILAVFAALGLGMAAPYLALAAVPGLHRFLPKPGRWMVRLRQVMGVALAGTAVWLLAILGAQVMAPPPLADSPRTSKAEVISWEPFDPDAIPLLVAQGKTVFVDVTADWCLTCQVNKRTVLYRGQVRALLQSPDVVAMQGDWTRPNAAIADYLRSFGRYAIPFDAIYGPLTPEGVPLSELLSTAEVTAALAKANR